MAVFITMILITIVGLVVLSPLALAEIAHFRSDWVQLSNIGQTYGAISAVLSALALGGIIASLLYQARDTRIAHEQMSRTFQFDLIKMELEDPSLMVAMGAPWGADLPSDPDSLREFLYVQMWVSYLASSYVTGEASKSTVRQVAAFELFQGRAGRTYWSAVGKRQLANSRGRRNYFFRLIDDEYNKAISSGVPVLSPVNSLANSVSARGIPKIRSKLSEHMSDIVIAALIGMLTGWFLRCAGDANDSKFGPSIKKEISD
jgi:uncharacterized membrane protein (Fun14 family)